MIANLAVPDDVIRRGELDLLEDMNPIAFDVLTAKQGKPISIPLRPGDGPSEIKLSGVIEVFKIQSAGFSFCVKSRFPGLIHSSSFLITRAL
jgi:hypothetical protein